MTKRYFWRRFLAFFIDVFVMNIIASIPVMAITSVFVSMNMGPIMSAGDCKPAQGRSDVVQLLNLQPDETATYFECSSTALLMRGKTTFLVMIDKRNGKPHFPRIATVIDDGSGLRRADVSFGLPVLMPSLAVGFALPAAFAFFSAKGRQTLGKKLVGLRVKRTDDLDPMLPQALAREYWKFLPNLLLSVAMAAIIVIYGDTLLTYFEDAIANLDFAKFFKLLAIIPAAQLLIAIWWLLPFIVWRGQTWHDMLAGTKVVRAEQA